jgi:hypothetical protein
MKEKNSSNNKYMGKLKVPGDFGDEGKVMHISTMQGPGGKVQNEPCQYSSSYPREAYNYKY